MWHYSLSRYIAFMDDTAELRHPSIPSRVVEGFLGFSVTPCFCLQLKCNVDVATIYSTCY
jgi:hypothetical protein